MTVKNGTVTGFDTRVVLDGGAGSRLTGLVVTANGEGIGLISSTGNTVSRNLVKNNPPIGIELRDALDHRVTGNTLRRNAGSLFVVGSDNVLSGNVITDDGSSAVGFEGDRNTFRNNRIQRAASAGVNFRGSGHQITGNVITDITLSNPVSPSTAPVATTTASPATRSAAP